MTDEEDNDWLHNMIDAKFNSKCARDFKKHHHWERIGVIEGKMIMCAVWQCTQCKKCVFEPLDFL